MGKDSLQQKVNSTKLITSSLTHNLFAKNLRGDLNDNKTQPSQFSKVSSNINKDRNEMFKQTQIVFDPQEKTNIKFSNVKIVDKQDHLKNFKDVVSQPKSFSSIRLKQNIDKKENFQPKKKELYERFYNERPSINSQSRKLKVDFLFKGSSLDYNNQKLEHYSNHYCNIEVDLGELHTPKTTMKAVGMNQSNFREDINKKNAELIRDNVQKRPLEKANNDKISNQDGRMLTESIKDLKSEPKI
eukprot:CAMPEP_0170519202 /NCGR_PEP_ID=MMETSP0209-20121228/4705_1 /TAXON_ID=665100 ORGANISM="Litonotus pictus, Strain P1" /NCGR_SAMPLE_ID=MMETSP0209 /ASSEMBLY_ACC=CAM_ASM_000301 /LENGTH=242 /DNA_ID=CAMNT_0010805029 /DNA_START=18 /DNA_END=745 /DNA_ORIENTATION=-